MIEFDGIQFNDLISGRVMEALAAHDSSLAELGHDDAIVDSLIQAGVVASSARGSG